MTALEVVGGCLISRGLWPPVTAYLNPLKGRKGQVGHKCTNGRGGTAPIILAQNAGD